MIRIQFQINGNSFGEKHPILDFFTLVISALGLLAATAFFILL